MFCDRYRLRTARDRVRPALLVLGVGLLGASAIGCSEKAPNEPVAAEQPPIRSTTGVISNAADFLVSATESWKAGLPVEGVEVADDAGCFFVLDEDAVVTGQISCGGARLGGSDDGQVWFPGSFDVVGGEAVDFALGDVPLPTERPDETLADGTGAAPPASLDEVEAPPLPEAPADLVVHDVDTAGLYGDRVEPGAEGEIRLPGQTIRITSITRVLSAPGEDGGLVVAGPGRHLYVVSLASTVDEEFPWTVPPTDLVLEDGRSLEITDDGGVAVLSSFLVSSTDSGLLAFSLDNHKVTASVATGARSADPVTDVLYGSSAPRTVSKNLDLKTRTVRYYNSFSGETQRYGVTYTTHVDRVRLTPYLPADLTGEAGRWVDEGSVFLVVEVSGEHALGDASTDVVSTTQRWRARVDGADYEGSPIVMDQSYEPTYVSIVELPAGPTTVELTMSATTQLEPDVYDVNSVDHGSATFSVDLS